MSRRISYIFDKDFIKHCDKIPCVSSRSSIVHELIYSYNLLQYMNIVPCKKATFDELKLFHSSDYINYLQNITNTDSDNIDEEQLEFGLCYDCPLFDNLFNTLMYIAGGTLTAALEIMNENADIAINWNGGWHHAQRDEAEGFCYINDIVIAIEKLKEKFRRILYIDFDIHHGNGVENAFIFTKKVFTLSFHKYEPGFYPGSGAVCNIGSGNGKGYTCNVPFKAGISDDSLYYVFNNIYPKIIESYQPEIIVVQCGGDCLNEDPLGQCNITLDGLSKCVMDILKWQIPIIFLGGGGYNISNIARLWTYLTAVITSQEQNISLNIPDNKYFLNYGPGYELSITKGCQKDTNSKEYLDTLITIIQNNLIMYDIKPI